MPTRAMYALVGDSIAANVAPYMSECLSDALGGIPSADVITRVHSAEVLIVSAGSNDPDNPRLVDNLKAIRTKATGRVVWISPMNKTAALAVRRVAILHGDPIVHFEPGPDGNHPLSYEILAAELRKFLR